MKPTHDQIRAAAAALANQRFMRNGSPPIKNVLDMLPEKLRTQCIEDATAALNAASEVAADDERT